MVSHKFAGPWRTAGPENQPRRLDHGAGEGNGSRDPRSGEEPGTLVAHGARMLRGLRRLWDSAAEGGPCHVGRRGRSAGRQDRLSGGDEDRLPRHPPQDGGGRRRRRGILGGRGRGCLPEDRRCRQGPRPQCQGRGRPGPRDADGPSAGGDRRRGHRSQLRQAGRLRAGRRPGRGAEGRDLPPGSRQHRGCALDARRHPGSGGAARRPRRRPDRPRRAREGRGRRLEHDRGLPRDPGDRPQSDLRDQGRGDRGRRADLGRLHAEKGDLPAVAGGDPGRHAADLPSPCGGRGRRLGGGRQDRQLGDEEPDQRRLSGRDLSRSTPRPTRSSARRSTRAFSTFPARSISRSSRSPPSSAPPPWTRSAGRGSPAPS